MKVTLSQQERTRLYRLLAGHQADALTLHRVRQLMDDLADWPEEWDQFCQQERICRIALDKCRHRDEEIVVSKRAAKIIEDMLSSKSKANQLTADQISLVEKFAPELLPGDEDDADPPSMNGKKEAEKVEA